METKMVAVLRYYSCDGNEFDSSDKCLAYEREKMVRLDNEINVTQVNITTLKQKANECRLQFHIAKLDAIDALDAGDVITFHNKMVEYYMLKNNYNKFISKLYSERKFLNELIDDYYMWFGGRRKKSRYAKQNRRKKSLRWR